MTPQATTDIPYDDMAAMLAMAGRIGDGDPDAHRMRLLWEAGVRHAHGDAARRGMAVDRDAVILGMDLWRMVRHLTGFMYGQDTWSTKPTHDPDTARAIRAYVGTYPEPLLMLKVGPGRPHEDDTRALGQRVLDALLPDPEADRARAERHARREWVLATKRPLEARHLYFSEEAERALSDGLPWHDLFVAGRARWHGLPDLPAGSYRMYWTHAPDHATERGMLAAMALTPGAMPPDGPEEHAALVAVGHVIDRLGWRGAALSDPRGDGWAAHLRLLAFAAGRPRDMSREAFRDAADDALRAAGSFREAVVGTVPGVRPSQADGAILSLCGSLRSILSMGAAFRRHGPPAAVPGSMLLGWERILPAELSIMDPGAIGTAAGEAAVRSAEAEKARWAKRTRAAKPSLKGAFQPPLPDMPPAMPVPPGMTPGPGSDAAVAVETLTKLCGCGIDTVSLRRALAGKEWKTGFLAGRTASFGLPRLPEEAIHLYLGLFMQAGYERGVLGALAAIEGAPVPATEMDLAVATCLGQAWTILDPAIWDERRGMRDAVGASWASYGVRVLDDTGRSGEKWWTAFEGAATDARDALRAFVRTLQGAAAFVPAGEDRVAATAAGAARLCGSFGELARFGHAAVARGLVPGRPGHRPDATPHDWDGVLPHAIAGVSGRDLARLIQDSAGGTQARDMAGAAVMALDPAMEADTLDGLLSLAGRLDEGDGGRLAALLDAAARDLFSGRQAGTKVRRSEVVEALALRSVMRRALGNGPGHDRDGSARASARRFLDSLGGRGWKGILSDGPTRDVERAVEEAGDAILATLFPDPAFARRLEARREERDRAFVLAGVDRGVTWMTAPVEAAILAGRDWRDVLLRERATLAELPVPDVGFATLYTRFRMGSEADVLRAVAMHPDGPVPVTVEEIDAMDDVGWAWRQIHEGGRPDGTAIDDLSGGWVAYRRGLDGYFGPPPEGCRPSHAVEAARDAFRALAVDACRLLGPGDSFGRPDVAEVVAQAYARRCMSLDDAFAFGRLAADEGLSSPGRTPAGIGDWKGCLPRGLNFDDLVAFARHALLPPGTLWHPTYEPRWLTDFMDEWGEFG